LFIDDIGLETRRLLLEAENSRSNTARRVAKWIASAFFHSALEYARLPAVEEIWQQSGRNTRRQTPDKPA
jgi:hypothetical protein